MPHSGSPPRMRGKVGRRGMMYAPPGITPAYAGKRAPAMTGWRWMGDHPRVCGEKVIVNIGVWLCIGSPPRMRGKAMLSCQGPTTGGITPAYAGKSVSSETITAIWGDHPRVCGEKRLIVHSDQVQQGSPPRMRGKDLESIEIKAPFFLCAQISFNF